jgi:putative membrane protein
VIESLPAVNATLNGIAACLLTAGWIAIRRKQVSVHKTLMISAFATSAVFLACYLTYHFHVPSKKFPGTGIWRPIYFYVILIPHVVLATGMLPFIFLTFYRAFRGELDRHRRLARWTLPIWLYVSITGVIVYVMLYRIDWGG